MTYRKNGYIMCLTLTQNRTKNRKGNTMTTKLAGDKICTKCGSNNISWGGGHFDGHEPTKCLDCGQVEPELTTTPDPCWVCGNAEPTVLWSATNGWGGDFGEFTGIPEVPNELNLCKGCQEVAKHQMVDHIRGLMQDGWDGSM